MALQLYTQDFYRDVVKPKLNPDGVFVTQSGPAGVLSSTEVFTAIHKTLQSAFPAVLPYAYHIPSYNDAWVGPCNLCICQTLIAVCLCLVYACELRMSSMQLQLPNAYGENWVCTVPPTN